MPEVNLEPFLFEVHSDSCFPKGKRFQVYFPLIKWTCPALGIGVQMKELNNPIDLFHNGFHHFLQALSILAKPPEVQCEEMGDYNVAWELRDDVGAGEYLAKSNFGQLTPAEVAAYFVKNSSTFAPTNK